ncbi:MAG: DMT family transporter [Hyphomonadaceae bacterium]|nr:DMT family transporter [Hyphomonadaceae bacterium]
MWMLAASVSFSVMTTLIKFLGADYPAPLQTFYRQAAGLIILLPFIARRGLSVLHTARPMMVLSRSVMTTIGMTLTFYAFQKLPLAEANALSFTRSLWLTLLAAVLMREHVGPLRIGAVTMGFVGVLVMLLPKMGGEHALSLAVGAMLLAAFLLAFGVAGMKVLTRDHTPTVIMMWSVILGFGFSIPGAVLTWRWPEPVDLALLCVMGIIGTINQALYIRGMQAGDAAAMAPIDYTRLIFAALSGYIFFNELPDGWTVAGAIIIVVSTLVVTIREYQLSRRASNPTV